jgi:hypothetical protein
MNQLSTVLAQLRRGLLVLLGKIDPREIQREAVIMPEPQTQPTKENPDVLLPWENIVSSANNRHNVRVLCDLAGLSLYDKNVITACIEQESDFNPLQEGRPNENGTHDWGICQFNDGSIHGVPLWIGPGAAFETVHQVLSNPQQCVELMITEYKAGHINWWVSYSSGAYKKYMPNLQ